LDDISGVPPTDTRFHESFDHYYDNLSARQCHSKPLPCKLVNGVNSTTCVDQTVADEVYRLGQYEYSYIYRDDPRSLAASATSYGVWIGELTTYIRDFIHGTSDVIYRHNVAHDGSLSRLLSVLQLDVMVWPGMGSEVVFELYKKDTNTSPTSTGPTGTPSSASGYYIRVLWKGQVLRSSNPSLGLMDMVPLETVLGYFDGLVGVGASLVVGKCNGSIRV
jgi:acid phosphatase